MWTFTRRYGKNSPGNSLTLSTYWITFQCICILPHSMSVEVNCILLLAKEKDKTRCQELRVTARRKNTSTGSHQKNQLQFALFVYQVSCHRTRSPTSLWMCRARHNACVTAHCGDSKNLESWLKLWWYLLCIHKQSSCLFVDSCPDSSQMSERALFSLWQGGLPSSASEHIFSSI